MNVLSLFSLLSLLLFSMGLFGFLTRRSGIVMLMSLELMLNGINLLLISFSKHHGVPEGSTLALLIVLVAAAEASLALSIFVILFRRLGTVALDEFRALRG